MLLNWVMEFKKFLPGFKVVAYHGTAPARVAIRKSFSEKDKDKNDDGMSHLLVVSGSSSLLYVQDLRGARLLPSMF